jgi:hypothetical protein
MWREVMRVAEFFGRLSLYSVVGERVFCDITCNRRHRKIQNYIIKYLTETQLVFVDWIHTTHGKG